MTTHVVMIVSACTVSEYGQMPQEMLADLLVHILKKGPLRSTYSYRAF